MMTSLERFYAAVRFQEVDRMPVDLHDFAVCAKISEKTFDRFVFDPRIWQKHRSDCRKNSVMTCCWWRMEPRHWHSPWDAKSA